YDLLTHMVCPLSGNNVKCACYLLELGLMKWSEEDLNKALEVAIMYKNKAGISVLVETKYVDQSKEKMRESALKYRKEKSTSVQLLEYLKQETTEKELATVMNALMKTMKKLIKDRKLVSHQVLNLCWLFDRKEIATAMVQKCQELLFHSDTLAQRPNDWQWLQEYVVDNTDLLLWWEMCDPSLLNLDLDVKKEESKMDIDMDMDMDIHMDKNKNDTTDMKMMAVMEMQSQWKGLAMSNHTFVWQDIEQIFTYQIYQEMHKFKFEWQQQLDDNANLQCFQELCSWNVPNSTKHSQSGGGGDDDRHLWRQDQVEHG
ncbi:hypothetical protein RFI_05105, partial [Reticulomyxa filosa]